MEELFNIFMWFAIPTIIFCFIERILHREDLKKCKSMTKRIKAIITKWELKNDVFQDDSNSTLGKPIYVTYEFVVNSQTYSGFGIKLNYNIKKVNVFYNPKNPNENITAYEKSRATGTDIIMVMMFGFLGLVGPILLTWIF